MKEQNRIVSKGKQIEYETPNEKTNPENNSCWKKWINACCCCFFPKIQESKRKKSENPKNSNEFGNEATCISSGWNMSLQGKSPDITKDEIENKEEFFDEKADNFNPENVLKEYPKQLLFLLEKDQFCIIAKISDQNLRSNTASFQGNLDLSYSENFLPIYLPIAKHIATRIKKHQIATILDGFNWKGRNHFANEVILSVFKIYTF